MVGLYFRDFFPEDFFSAKIITENFFSENFLAVNLNCRAMFKKLINRTLVWRKA